MRPLAPRHRATLAIVGGWLLFFSLQLIDTGGVPYERDLTQLYIPLRFFLHAQLKSGHLPQWFPYEMIGVPYLGQIVTATFHPQTLLFLPFAPVTAVKFNILLAYLLGAGGAYRFARAVRSSRAAGVLAAFAFAFSGYGLSLHNNPPYLMGMMTLPWVAWRALRLVERERLSDIAGLALAWGLVFLAGDIQGTGFAAVLVLAALVGGARSAKSIGLATAAVVLMFALIAIELLPSLSVFSGTFRLVTDVGDAPARVWALHPLRFLEMLIPGFLPAGRETEIAQHLLDTGTGGLWALSVFTGVVSTSFLVLGLSRRRATLAFALLAGLSLWMALGAHGGLLPLVFRIVKPLSHFAYPEKYLALFAAATIPLIALGFDRAATAPRRTVATFAAVSGAALLGTLRLHPTVGEEWSTAVNAAWRHGALISIGFAAVAVAALVLARRYPLFKALPVAICFVELWRANTGIVTLADRRQFEKPTPIAERVQQSAQPGMPVPRVAAVPAAGVVGTSMHAEPDRWTRSQVEGLKPDAAAVFGIGTIGMALLPALPSRMLTVAAPEPTSWSRWLRACWRTEPLTAQLPNDQKVVLTDPDTNTQLVSQPCFPYAFTGGALHVNDEGESQLHMNQGLPPNMIMWEDGPSFARPRAHVVADHFEPGLVTLTADAEGTAALVITEGYAPGWSATIDGAPARIRPTNLVVMGIELPAGHHAVRFEYRTPQLMLGAAISAFALLLIVGLLWTKQRSRSLATA
jgi:hypothetical protein